MVYIDMRTHTVGKQGDDTIM